MVILRIFSGEPASEKVPEHIKGLVLGLEVDQNPFRSPAPGIERGGEAAPEPPSAVRDEREARALESPTAAQPPGRPNEKLSHTRKPPAQKP